MWDRGQGDTVASQSMLAISYTKAHGTQTQSGRVGSGRVGSDDLGYGPGSGFSLKPVQTSNRDNGENIFFLNNCLN